MPQKVYGHGNRQWDFVPSEPTFFNVNGFPGINMGDALRKVFTGLDGRDDTVLQNATQTVSCRLLVWSSPCFPPRISADVASSSPGTRLMHRTRYRPSVHLRCRVLTRATDFHLGLDEESHPDNPQQACVRNRQESKPVPRSYDCRFTPR